MSILYTLRCLAGYRNKTTRDQTFSKHLTNKLSNGHIQRVVKDFLYRDAGTHLRGTFFCVAHKETGTGLFHRTQGLYYGTLLKSRNPLRYFAISKLKHRSNNMSVSSVLF